MTFTLEKIDWEWSSTATDKKEQTEKKSRSEKKKGRT